MLGLILLIMCAGAYFKIAEADNRNGALWAVISIACWFAGGAVYGFAGALIGQVMPFVLMMISSMMKK